MPPAYATRLHPCTHGVLFAAPQRLIPPWAHAGRETIVALDDVHGLTYAGFGGRHAGLTAPGAHLRVP